MDLPKLRTLRIESCGLTRENLASITSAKWPKVERAELLFGSANYGCDVELADLEPILEGETFPSVRHLGLMNSELADAIAARIVRSKVLERLETLDLSLGTMARDGARALLENAPALAHLELLDVNENYLTAEEVSTLQALGRPAVRSKEQKKDDDSIPGEIYRYVTVAE